MGFSIILFKLLMIATNSNTPNMAYVPESFPKGRSVGFINNDNKVPWLLKETYSRDTLV